MDQLMQKLVKQKYKVRMEHYIKEQNQFLDLVIALPKILNGKTLRIDAFCL